MINHIVLILIRDPMRTSSKCPAEILATKRTVRVIGRIKFLTSSIQAINGARAKGLPSGIIWVNINLGRISHLKIYWPNQTGNIIVIAKKGWAVQEKM